MFRTSHDTATCVVISAILRLLIHKIIVALKITLNRSVLQ